MIPKERQSRILRALQEEGRVEIDSLATNLSVSPMTIRRDLGMLEERGECIRTHGGAVLTKLNITETPYMTKESQHLFEKRMIAEEAVRWVRDVSTILLDSGTTTLEIAKRLPEDHTLTVITNDVRIAAYLVDTHHHVIVTGGELQQKVGALFGPLTEQLLRDIHVELFFMGAHAIHPDAGITAPTIEKAKLKHLMIHAAEQTWVVADSSKFQQKSFAKVCDLNEVNGVLTNSVHDLEWVREQTEVRLPTRGDVS